MGTRIKEIDAYINKSADFAQPILQHLRNLIHDTCEDVEEKIKWGFPHFDYKAEMMCSMAAFTKHCAFGFWKAAIMKDPVLLETARSETAMGHLGKITSIRDLPSDKKLRSWIREAMALNEKGIKLPSKPKSTEKKELTIPDYFMSAIRKNKTALNYFEQLAYSHQKEYIQWIMEAKTEPTREKRLQQAIDMLAEKKTRNWKYK